ncbi:MAG: autotransporter outer membrane beta-barrel domain-containing protein [Alphaproteobacteria bacterium]|nr:autotransporter outer membrane beta-barrel domain-containing protein [Alphaproteobacteria bacterium]
MKKLFLTSAVVFSIAAMPSHSVSINHGEWWDSFNQWGGYMYGGTINNLNSGAYLYNMNSSNATATIINNMNGGYIDNVNGYASVWNPGGWTNYYYENAIIYNMYGGTINNISYARIDNMNGWGAVINNLNDSATVYSMNNGRITNINYGRISNMYGGEVQNFINGNIDTLHGGQINNMQGGYIGTLRNYGNIRSMTGGHIYNMYDNSLIMSMSGNARIDNMYDGTIYAMNGDARINNMNFGTIINKSNGYIENMRGGTIVYHNGGTINRFTNGTINNNAGEIRNMYNEGYTRIDSMTGGVITNLFDGYVGTVSGGTIENMFGGRIENLDGRNIVAMFNGQIGNIKNGGHIGLLMGGEIQDISGGSHIDMMTSGNIRNLRSSSIGTITSGRIDDIHDDAYIGLMTGGDIGTIHQGSVGSMTAGYIHDFSGSSWMGLMTGGSIGMMTDRAYIDNFNGGFINAFHGGYLNNIGRDADLGNIDNLIIIGNVESGGSTLDLNPGGYLLLGASDANNIFARDVNIGAGGGILELKQYTYDSNITFAMSGENSSIIISDNNLILPRILVGDEAAGARIEFSHYTADFKTATISQLDAHSDITFVMNTDYDAGIADHLTILSVLDWGVVDHKLAVGAANVGVIQGLELIDDQSGIMNFTLANGADYVGIGARNYVLANNAGIWSLNCVGDNCIEIPDDGNGNGGGGDVFVPTLSDAATNIGMHGAHRFHYAVRDIQNALHKRLGDLRLAGPVSKTRVWARTYGNQTEFNDLTKVKGNNFGAEAGIDRDMLGGSTTRMILGGGAGINSASHKTSALASRDGGGSATVPYANIYLTTLFPSNVYIDLIGRMAFLDSYAYYYDGADNKIDYTTKSLVAMVSAELGYQYKATDRLILEPRAELVYAYIDGDKFTDSAGFTGQYDASSSLSGQVGFLMRYNFESVQPYAKFTYLREFDGRTNITYDGVLLNSELPQSRYEYGIGLVGEITARMGMFGEFTYQHGDKEFKNYGANMGIRANF